MRLLNRLRESSLSRNVLTLYGVQACTYILPLVTIPYMTRVLGVAGWGRVAFVQSVAQYFAIAIEYGFNLSAAREVAQAHGSQSRLSEIFSSVFGAKLILSSVAVLAFGALSSAGGLNISWRLALAGFVWALGQGFTTLWFFLGQERMRVVASLDLTSRVVGALIVLIVVRRPEDDYWALAAPAVAMLLAALIGHCLAWRECGFSSLSWSSSVSALAQGWAIFLQRGASSLYMAGNSFLLGLSQPSEIVGWYAAPERLLRAMIQMTVPLQQAVFPRVNRLVSHDPQRAHKLGKRAALVMTLLTGLVALGVFISAPLMVPLVLGGTYTASVSVMQVLSAVLPLSALSSALAAFFLLPQKRDKEMVRVLLLAGVGDIVLTVGTSRRMGAHAPGIALIAAHIIVVVGFLLLQRRPFRRADGATDVGKPVGYSMSAAQDCSE